MNLKQIGSFIADLRKENGLTQEQFGAKIGVTNKTISRWETGTYLPPIDALLTISELFDVSINEILSGKKLSSEEYKAEAEKNLRQTITASSFSLKEKIDFYKKKWLKDHVAILCFWGLCILGMFLTGMILKNPILTGGSMILLVFVHAWRNNTMMAYVEQHVFDSNSQLLCSEK